MREIKFRAVMNRRDGVKYVSEAYSIDNGLSYLFDFENNRWDKFLEMITTESKFIELFPDDNEHLNGWCHVQNIQFTGLKDKNGVEIYEGDVVKIDYPRYKHAEVHTVNFGNVGWEPFAGSMVDNGEKYEVIGNIYENQELLKGEE